MGIFANIFPEISVLLLSLSIIIIKLCKGKRKFDAYGQIAVIWLVATLAITSYFPSNGTLTWGGMYYVDRYASFFKLMILATAILVNLASISYVRKIGHDEAEFFAVLNFSLLGMMVFSSAGDFTTLYLGLELMTIAFIVLICFLRRNNLATEAGIKYLILSSMSSAVMLYGMSLIYGFFGTSVFAQIAKASDFPIESPLFIVGLLMFLSGFAFKISAVPFHMWAPDIYQAAPTPVAGFLAVGSKAAALAMLTRVLIVLFPAYQSTWGPIILAMALLSVVFGNLVAISQQDIKRMLAYSSIAQVGYLLLGILAATHLGVMAMMFYIAAYIFANMGAFVAVGAWEESENTTWRNDYAGMAKRAPFLAGAMFVFMVSLAGLPPMGGFIGKFLLFTAAIDAKYIVAAMIALFMSMISVYYYFQVVRAMYFLPEECSSLKSTEKINLSTGVFAALVICVFMSVVLGLFFQPIMNMSMLDSSVFFM